MRSEPLVSLHIPRVIALCLVAFAGLFVFSGCDTIDDLVDLELATNEAEYVPVEVAATLALGVTRAQDYGAYSSVVHHSYSVGQPITDDGCIDIALVEDIGADGHGSLRYDFTRCDGQGGAVQVQQTVTSVANGEQSWDEVVAGDDVDLDGQPDGLRDLLETRADVQVNYAGYREGELEMSGGMAFGGGVAGEGTEGGTLSADVAVSALDYRGALAAEGSWSAGQASDESRMLSFVGDFTSATGLTWTVIADNVEMVPDCGDAVGGQMTAIYENDMGSVEVTALFDDVCDGCATLVVDGVDQGRTCFAGSSWFGAGQGEETPAN